MSKIKLLDDNTGNIYTIEVSEEDAIKASQDMLFATQLLEKFKAQGLFEEDVTEAEYLCVEDDMYPTDEVIQEEDAMQEEIMQEEDMQEENMQEEDMQEETLQEETLQEETIQEEITMSDSSQDSFRWSHEAILLLLRIYEQHDDKIVSREMSMKKFWTMVASKLVANNFSVTSSQCKSKMAGLKITYRNVRDYNSKYGNSGRVWPYYDIMDQLFRDKPWAIPSATLDNNNPTSSSHHENSPDKNRNSSSPSKPESSSKQSRDCDLLDKVLSIAKESIIKRRKMHEEAMARQDRLLDILEKFMKK